MKNESKEFSIVEPLISYYRVGHITVTMFVVCLVKTVVFLGKLSAKMEEGERSRWIGDRW